jgi:hypothetical protein
MGVRKMDDEQLSFMGNTFDEIIWPKLKGEAKCLSRRDSAKLFFLAGYELAQHQFNELIKKADNDPRVNKIMKKLEKGGAFKEND